MRNGGGYGIDFSGISRSVDALVRGSALSKFDEASRYMSRHDRMLRAFGEDAISQSTKLGYQDLVPKVLSHSAGILGARPDGIAKAVGSMGSKVAEMNSFDRLGFSQKRLADGITRLANPARVELRRFTLESLSRPMRVEVGETLSQKFAPARGSPANLLGQVGTLHSQEMQALTRRVLEIGGGASGFESKWQSPRASHLAHQMDAGIRAMVPEAFSRGIRGLADVPLKGFLGEALKGIPPAGDDLRSRLETMVGALAKFQEPLGRRFLPLDPKVFRGRWWPTDGADPFPDIDDDALLEIEEVVRGEVRNLSTGGAMDKVVAASFGECSSAPVSPHIQLLGSSEAAQVLVSALSLLALVMAVRELRSRRGVRAIRAIAPPVKETLVERA